MPNDVLVAAGMAVAYLQWPPTAVPTRSAHDEGSEVGRAWEAARRGQKVMGAVHDALKCQVKCDSGMGPPSSEGPRMYTYIVHEYINT